MDPGSVCSLHEIMKYLLFMLFFALTSCETPVPPESQSDQLAKSLCDCSAQLLALNQQAQTANDSLSFRNIVDEFEKTRNCVAGLKIKAENRAGLEIALATKCPSLAANKDFLTELIGQ